MSNVVNLTKGARVNLSKTQPNLKKLRIELSWNENVTDTGSDFDADVSLFLLETLPDGKQRIFQGESSWFIFYGNLKSPDGSVIHGPDEKSGGVEKVWVDLSKISAGITEIPVIITIYEAAIRKQNFGQITKAKAQVFNDETGELLINQDLEENHSSETAVHACSVYKNDAGDWGFKSIDAGYNAGLDAFVKQFGMTVSG